MKKFLWPIVGLAVAIAVVYFTDRGVAQSTTGSLPGAKPTVDASRFSSLQAAIDALPATGGMIQLPAGDFEIREPLVIRAEDVCLLGAGTATHIKNLNEDGQPAILIAAPDPAKTAAKPKPSLWRIRLANFRVTGNPKHNGGGVDLRDAHGCAVSANTFTLMKADALRISSTSGRIAVSGNSFCNSYIGDGKLRRGTNDIAAAGMVLEDAQGVGVTGNVFSGLTTKNLVVAGTSPPDTLFSDNVIVDGDSDHPSLNNTGMMSNVWKGKQGP